MDWGEGKGCCERKGMGELIEIEMLEFHSGEKLSFVVKLVWCLI